MRNMTVALVCLFAVAGCKSAPAERSRELSPAGYGSVTEYDRTRIDGDRRSSDRTGTTVVSASRIGSSDADNSSANVRDRDGALPTPVDQGSGSTDIYLTSEIRKRILDAKLSMEAQNVKVITANRLVTLRGPVTSEVEKSTIDRIARDVAGAIRVENLLDVVASR